MLNYYYNSQNNIPFPDSYNQYNKLFTDEIGKNMHLGDAFVALTNTAFYEQYLVNCFQFSAAKNFEEMKLIQKELYDINGTRRNFSDFKIEAQKIANIFNGTWLRTEYDLASRGSIMAEEWRHIWSDRDLQPYVIYRTRDDARVRDEHRVLDGIKFRIDSPIGQNLYVPNGWNCRCYWDTTDNGEGKILNDKELNEYLTGKVEITNKNGTKTQKNIVEPQFRSNVGIDGIFPKGHSYNIKPANELDYKVFVLKSGKNNIQTRILSDYQILLATKNIIKHDNELVFRNFEWQLNYFMDLKTQKRLSKVAGFENINQCISKPSEIWAKWVDPNEQKTVEINFILNNNSLHYIVQTRNGYIYDAFVMKYHANNYRQGVLIVK